MTLTWYYDYRGHPLSQAQVQYYKHHCSDDDVIVSSEATPMAAKIADGFKDQIPACWSTIKVHAGVGVWQVNNNGGLTPVTTLDLSRPQDRSEYGNDLVTGVVVSIFNHALDYSSAVESRNLVLNAGEQRQQEETNAHRDNKPTGL